MQREQLACFFYVVLQRKDLEIVQSQQTKLKFFCGIEIERRDKKGGKLFYPFLLCSTAYIEVFYLSYRSLQDIVSVGLC